MTHQDDGLGAVLAAMARLPLPSPEGIARPQREAELAPLVVSTVPAPEFLPGGGARFRCPLGCGWFHEERPDLELPGPVRLPVNPTGEDIARAITAQAEERETARRQRVEQAIAGHREAAHPGRCPVRSPEPACDGG
ncbi:MAG TPA: hypothetical protein VK545_22175 [Streptomyces sp.]|nr:hypothetical protein [Streptomyces sp.]